MMYAPLRMVAPASGLKTLSTTVALGVVVVGVVVLGVVTVEPGVTTAGLGVVPVAGVHDSDTIGVEPLADVSPATAGDSPTAMGSDRMISWPVTLECA